MTAVHTGTHPDPAMRHRPETAGGLRHAAVALARQGLRARDIAAALRLTVPAVVALLDEDRRP